MTYIDGKILEKIKGYCAYQERCHSEVRYKLVDLGVRGDELEQIIGILIEENFLNEERYAQALVRGKLKYSHWGRKKIFDYLKQKGVSEYCIKKGMKEIDDLYYNELILELAEKKARSLESEKNAWVKQQKIVRYLLQKGFETNLVLALVGDVVE